MIRGASPRRWRRSSARARELAMESTTQADLLVIGRPQSDVLRDPLALCRICRDKEKPRNIDFFGSDPRTRSGLRTMCKSCESSAMKARAHAPNRVCRPYLVNEFCTICKDTNKPRISEFFSSDRSVKNGLKAVCRTCLSAKHKKWAATPAAKSSVRSRQIKSSYGLSADDYDRLFRDQCGRCAICMRTEDSSTKKRRILHVDHDHMTGLVRGLLCNTCNVGLGNFRDAEWIIARALIYLATRTRDV